MTIVRSDAPGMTRWRKWLFIAMARNATSPSCISAYPEIAPSSLGKQVAL